MKFTKILTIILGAFIIMSCSTKNENELPAKQNIFSLSEADYQSILKESVVSLGNTYRLKAVLKKLKKGDKVTLAALGGSVTEGAGPANFTDGYAYQFYRAMKAKYAKADGENFVFNNAGLSGTPSQLGLVRYQKDVVEVLGQTPDILIVEFAVNDGGDDFSQRAFEAIVRDALSANPETAVIALYSAATYGNTGAQKRPIAKHYQIPQLDILTAIKPFLDSGKIKKEAYYSDYVHPTFEGHQLMCECLMNMVDLIDKADKEKAAELPSTFVIQKPFSGMKMITGDDENVKISAGSFCETDANCQTIKKTNKSNFPQNWYKPSASDNTPFKMNITCKNLILTYKVQGSWLSEKFGSAEVYVDGKKLEDANGGWNGGKDGGWNNCEPRLIIDEEKAAKHSVEIKMAPGSESKGFTIVCMGYSL